MNGTWRRALISLAQLLVLGLAVHLLLPQVTALHHSADVLRSLALWALLLAILCQVLSYAASGYLMRSLVAVFGWNISLLRSVQIGLASYSLSMLWGGQLTYTAAAFRWMRAAGVSGDAAVLIGIIPALINVFTISMAALFGLLYLIVEGRVPTLLAAPFALAALLLVGTFCLVWLGAQHRTAVTGVVDRLARFWSRVRGHGYDGAATEAIIERLYGAGALLLRGGWRGPVVGDLMNVGFDILTLYLLFLAAHYRASPGIVLAGYGLPLLAGKLSILPGGVGIVEGGMAGLYEALGVPSGVTVVVILGYRLISFWIPVLLGFPLVPLLDRQKRPVERR